MAETKYLYGASIQGIQSYIFKTNKLKEIVGASELVEKICTSLFKEHLNGQYNDDNCITSAAGNIRYIFDIKEQCETFVRDFPMKVMEFAPGISISQAVVKMEGDFSGNLNDLELKLKAQRNKATIDVNKGLLITERSRRTGEPAITAICKGNGEFLDASTNEKQIVVNREDGNNNLSSRFTLARKFFGQDIDLKYRESFQYDSDKLTENEKKSYIAVIHADGNNLGKIIHELGKSLKNHTSPEKIKKVYQNFSKAIDEATQRAAQNAYTEIFNQYNNGKETIVPFRPIILGGDDLTVICEAKNAVKFTKLFLREFEIQTEEKLKKIKEDFSITITKLTACAGIAFVKSKFPFYYAADLAEQLCAEAKKVSKDKDPENVPSSLLFYKVESSFVDSYTQIKERVLTAKGVDFQYGPYYTAIDTIHKPSVEKLIDRSGILKQNDTPASSLRNWLSVLSNGIAEANLLMKRIIEIDSENKFADKLELKANIFDEDILKNKITHIYDIVTLASLTENEEE